MRPQEVMRDLSREFAAPANVGTLRNVMAGVARQEQVRGDEERIYLPERYRDLVAEECRAIRAT